MPLPLLLTSYSASTSYFLLHCPQECRKLREHTGPWMLPMPRDCSRQPLSPSPVQPSDSVLSVAKAASLPSTTLTLTFDPGRSMAEHTTSLAVTGSSPSCCCRQRYLLSGGQSAVQHKQGPHQALWRAESRKLRWFLAYSWMCAPRVPILLQYFCLPLWIVGELQCLLIPTVCGGGGGAH